MKYPSKKVQRDSLIRSNLFCEYFKSNIPEQIPQIHLYCWILHIFTSNYILYTLKIVKERSLTIAIISLICPIS